MKSNFRWNKSDFYGRKICSIPKEIVQTNIHWTKLILFSIDILLNACVYNAYYVQYNIYLSSPMFPLRQSKRNAYLYPWHVALCIPTTLHFPHHCGQCQPVFEWKNTLTIRFHPSHDNVHCLQINRKENKVVKFMCSFVRCFFFVLFLPGRLRFYNMVIDEWMKKMVLIIFLFR